METIAFEIFLPKLGANMVEGVVREWFVSEGDPVDAGDPLFEMETDKAVVEVTAEHPGVVRKIFVAGGQKAPISSVVGIIAKPGEDVTDLIKEISKRSEKTEKKVVPGPVKIQTTPVSTLEKPAEAKVKASPRARKLAKDLGIDLSRVKSALGSEIVTAEDVQRFKDEKMEAEKCVIIGAGEYSQVVREVIEIEGKYRIAGYVDDDETTWGKEIGGIPVLGGSKILEELPDRGIGKFIVSVGAPVFRKRLFEKAEQAGLDPINAVHPRAFISRKAILGAGCVIEAFAVVSVNCKVGKGTFITQCSSLSHDCQLGEFCHLAPGSHLGGSVNVGRGALVGVGVSVTPHVAIGENTIITPGSSVDGNVPANVVVEGCPGRVIGEKSEKFRI